MSALEDIQCILNQQTLDEEFHSIACGHEALLWLAAQEAKDDGQAAVAVFRTLLRDLERTMLPLTRGVGDPSLECRSQGLLHALRAHVCGDTDSWPLAAGAFQRSWRGPLPALEATPAATVADGPLARVFPASLTLETVGDWLVHDVLWHLSYSEPGQLANRDKGGLLAQEATPVLFTRDGNSTGLVLHLVAEVLPGPPGLVTPDWLPMGLVTFPESSSGEYADFLAVTQRAMTAVASAMQLPHRLRWRLEYRGSGSNPWGGVFNDDSATAAAALVARAACEAFAGGGKDLLGRDVAITACLPAPNTDITDLFNVSLGRVDGKTLPYKVNGARDAQISLVLVAEGQGTEAGSHGVQLVPCATLDDAYVAILDDNRYVRGFHKHIIEAWAQRWAKEETA